MGWNEEQEYAVGGATGGAVMGDPPKSEGAEGEVAHSQDCTDMVETCSDVPTCSSQREGEGGGPSEGVAALCPQGVDPLCPEDITNMWNEFYNCMYWHHIQCYKYGIGSGAEGTEEVMEKEEPSVERSVEEEASSVVRVVVIVKGWGGGKVSDLMC